MTLKLDQIDNDILLVLIVLYCDKKLATSKFLTQILQTPHPGLTRRRVSMKMRKLHNHGLAVSEDRGFTKPVLYWQITRTGWLTLKPDSDKAPKEQTIAKVEWDASVQQYKLNAITKV